MYQATAQKWDLDEAQVKTMVDLVDSRDWGLLKNLLESLRGEDQRALENSDNLNNILRAQGSLRLSRLFIGYVEDVVRDAVEEIKS